MSIRRVTARALRIRVPVPALGDDAVVVKPTLLVEVESDDGLVGHGVSGHVDPEPLVHLIDLLAPSLLGREAMATEAISASLHGSLVGRGQTGLAFHAISAIDIALWDLKGKRLGLPIWALLGGEAGSQQLYATVGAASLGPTPLAALASEFVAEGFSAIKLVVGDRSMASGGTSTLTGWLDSDVRAIAEVRDAVGDRVEIYLSARCELTVAEALDFTDKVRPFNVALFQEPTIGNRAEDLAELRHRGGIAIATGQSIGSLDGFRQLLAERAVDRLQPNVVTVGGFTGAAKVSALAQASGVGLIGGGSWMYPNLHLLAAAPQATLAEWFLHRDQLPMRALYPDLPERSRGQIVLPAGPGLGIEPDPAAVARWDVAG